MNRSAPTRIIALLALVFGVPAVRSLGAQAGPPPQRATIRVRVLNPSQAQLDSLHALMRQLEELTPGSPAREILLRQIDSFMPRLPGGPAGAPDGPQVMLHQFVPGMRVPSMGWIGLNVQGLGSESIGKDSYVVEYFDHPLVTSVDPDSPAKRAGVAPGDVLIAYNGADVLGRQLDLTDLLVPDKKITVTIKRDGDTKVYDMTVAKAPVGVALRRRDLGSSPEGDVYIERIMKSDDDDSHFPMIISRHTGQSGAQVFFSGVLLTPNGALGATMSTVSPELARALKLETGVLVNDVSDDTPASKAGLRPGDVIVAAGDQPVTSLHALQEQILRRTEPSVVLQVVRDRKHRRVTVSW